MMNRKPTSRLVSDDGGRTSRVRMPTFEESLLMEILIQIIPAECDDERIRRVLIRAGFTDEEIAERLR